ncbi:hypothetical protein [Paenibacillus periandrae]|uniref:hypothetical protein n=1 Tax=Paenibacillus periandrae TaxID=1761741 RepID=UPI001F09CE55|nr:hypothetical protein [Paenibacillus periandrae]
MKTQKDWLDYINRLQDRERQKITSGGLSNWALYLALAGLGYWVYPDIVDMQKHWLTTLVGYAFFHNLSISLFDIFNYHYRQGKIKAYYNPIAMVDVMGIIPLRFFQKIVILIAVLINGYLVYHTILKEFYVLVPFYWIFFFRHFSELATLLVSKKVKQYKRIVAESLLRLAKKLNPEHDREIVEVNKMKLEQEFNFTAIIKIIIPLYFMIYVCLHYNFNDLLWKQIFDGLALVIIIILIQFLLMIFLKRMKIAWLEKLEREIIQNNLNQRTIIERLNNNYFNLSKIDDYF